MTERCPNCGVSITGIAEAAAHECATGPTDQEIDLAEQASKKALEERRKIKPTKERLLRDCISAAQQLNDFWDGDVEVVVAMIPRGEMSISYVTSIRDPEKLHQVLKRMLRDTTKISTINNKAKS